MIRGILMTGSLLRGHAGLLKHAAGKAFPRAARQLSTQQVAKGGRGRVLSALGLAAAGGGIFLAVDDSRLTMGIKRSLVFWVQAFPMYLHYRCFPRALPSTQPPRLYRTRATIWARHVRDFQSEVGLHPLARPALGSQTDMHSP